MTLKPLGLRRGQGSSWDGSGCRFGAELYWTQLRNHQHLARFARPVGLALWRATPASTRRISRMGPTSEEEMGRP